MKHPLITIKNIRKTYPKKQGQRRVEALCDVTLTIERGEFLILLGPSGCGKSTLLRILAGLDTKTSGSIVYSSEFNPERINVVFQNFALLPWLTVRQNIELGLIGRGVPESIYHTQTSDILKKFDLYHFKDSFPHEISGGMKQRVGLARAFVTKPEIIFLDEPFSELDFFTAASLRELLLTMWREYGTTVVMVSHYIDEAVALADRIAIFSPRPSSITQIVSNTIVRPRTARSVEFFAKEDEVLSYFKHPEK